MSAELDDEEQLVSERVVLTRDPACFRALSWVIELVDPITDWDEFHSRLLAKGWCESTRLPRLWDLRQPEGHRLVVIPGTGRLQLRLHFLVPADERRAKALGLAEHLAK